MIPFHPLLRRLAAALALIYGVASLNPQSAVYTHTHSDGSFSHSHGELFPVVPADAEPAEMVVYRRSSASAAYHDSAAEHAAILGFINARRTMRPEPSNVPGPNSFAFRAGSNRHTHEIFQHNMPLSFPAAFVAPTFPLSAADPLKTNSQGQPAALSFPSRGPPSLLA
jgi:hypothetical protein